MAIRSPSPDTSPFSISPTSVPPPPQPSSPPPQSSTNTNVTSPQSPPPTNSTSPLSSPSTKATPPQSIPSTSTVSPLSPLSTKASPPQSIPSRSAVSPLSPPMSVLSPPPSIPVISPPPATLAPTSSPPTPTTFSSPPPSALVANRPTTSPPPLSPPSSSPPPPTSPPPASPSPPSSPSPSSPPPTNSPPPSAAEPPASPPPPRKSPSPTPPVTSPPPPKNLPPPPSSDPPESSSAPPPTTPTPPQISSPPPAVTPEISPPPPSQSPPPPGTPKVSPSPPSQAPPSPIFSPPPPSHVQVPPPPSNPTTNSTSGNAPEISSSDGNGGLGTVGVAAIGVVLGLILLSVVGIAVCFVRRRKKRNSHSNGDYVLPTSRFSTPQSDSGLLKAEASASRYVSASGNELVNSPSKRGILGHSRTWFTYEELVLATDGFSPQNLLGEGGFGSVYKGFLPNGEEVAVKQLKIGGEQGEREFKAEVEIISRIHHRHLVSLAGYCIWESRRLLVYEFVPNNNLHFHLHGEGRPVMEWATRVKIAAGAARGIAYLHEDCHPRVIHRDIKSSNILLDNNFEARVSDFGLAKLALDANTHVTTRVVGTFGYMAPEYASSGKLTEKSDVYSFGVVLLELITGRKPVDTSRPLGDENLVAWARPLLNQALETDEFEGLADPKLDKNYVDSEMLQMVEVAAACVRHSAVKRPRMGQVVRAFESMVAPDITNGVPVGDSEIYNTPAQSSEIRWFRRMAFGNQDFSSDFFSRNSSMHRSRSLADQV